VARIAGVRVALDPAGRILVRLTRSFARTRRAVQPMEGEGLKRVAE
jgi:hypothetical protein